MAFRISPGVSVSEIDLTTIIPAVGTTGGALVGEFQWGPVEVVTLVDTEKTLVNKFGKPNSTNATTFFQGANFLSYSNNLKVARIVGSAARNATSDGAGLLIKNLAAYEAGYSTGQGSVGSWAAKYPGILGNSLKVSICPAGSLFSDTSITGTVDVSADSTTVTAGNVATSFTTELTVGSYITIGGVERKITAIASNSSLTVNASFSSLAINEGTISSARWEYSDEFSQAPGTSDYVAARDGSNDEIHVVVVDEDGVWTGTKGTVLEKFAFLSIASDAKDSANNSIYYATAISRSSNYVYWMDHPVPASPAWGSVATSDFNTITNFSGLSITTSLAGGLDGTATNGDLQTGWDLFANADEVDISFAICPPVVGASVGSIAATEYAVANYVINNICESRKDVIAVVSPRYVDVVSASDPTTNVVAYRNVLQSSSYAIMDSGWKYQYDKYNDTFRWIPFNADIAGLCVRTDLERDAWFSPAGFNRGIVKNAIKSAWNPTEAQRDSLYVVGINPVTTFPGQGIVLFGDKTLLKKPSAFDRINVRRLFIILEKAIATASKYTLFELNDDFTRASFVNLVEPYLRDIQGRRGIYDFRVVCDTTNNTPEVIDRNEFVGDIYIKPARSINFIQLNFVAVRTGVAFEEIVGKF